MATRFVRWPWECILSGRAWGSPRQSYQSPTGKVEVAHVGPLTDAKLNFLIDQDRKGFVLVAGIPQERHPGLPRLSGDVRAMVNLEATFAGHNKFWWANSDGSANRETYDEPSEARLIREAGAGPVSEARSRIGAAQLADLRPVSAERGPKNSPRT